MLGMRFRYVNLVAFMSPLVNWLVIACNLQLLHSILYVSYTIIHFPHSRCCLSQLPPPPPPPLLLPYAMRHATCNKLIKSSIAV